LLLVEFNGSQATETLCRYLQRENGLPIIVLVPLENIDNLDSYADDFVTKPYNAKEVAARAQRLVKKKSGAAGEQIKIGEITINTETYEVYVNGRLVSLTFKEYELLKFLASHSGKVFTRDTLLNQIWGEDYFGGDRTVDVHIRRLRSKIEDRRTFTSTLSGISATASLKHG